MEGSHKSFSINTIHLSDTLLLAEMSIKSIKIMFMGSRGRPARRAGNLTAICEAIVYTVWGTQHLTILYASTTCSGDSFTFFTSTKWGLHFLSRSSWLPDDGKNCRNIFTLPDIIE
jgi:hypothetical protein